MRIGPSSFGLVLGAALLAATSAMPTFAQTSRGAISGTVTDASGAVVPGATIQLVQVATGAVRSTTTNEAGIYRFDAVDLGVYTLKIGKPGFKIFSSTVLGVEANRTTTLDATLEVGGDQTVVEVNGETAELLVKDAPLRGGNFAAHEVSRLPLTALNPISLGRTLPGVSQPAGNITFGERATQFAVNGQRPRANNYLLDGADNNDTVFSGVAQMFNIADAVEEVSAQTGNFGVEFGRAGGGVLNVITRSGTNAYRGTALWEYRSQRFNSVSNLDKLNGAAQSVFSQNVYGFTFGGPIRRNQTFFFGAFQQDTFRSTRQYPFVFPTADGVARLRLLFPSNPRLDFYLDALDSWRGLAKSFDLALGANRGSVRFATTPVGVPLSNEGPEWLFRVDHNLSQAHRVSLRYVYDSRVASPDNISNFDGVYFPGYISDQRGRSQNFLVTDSYTIRSTWTNEFRFSYGRFGVRWPISDRSVPLATTLFRISIPNIATPGINQNLPQFRFWTSWLFQETQTKVAGRHTFRYGVELLRQLARQRGTGFIERGQLTYTDSAGFSAFANFLDDFSGPSGTAGRTFGDSVFRPSLFRQAYFFQETWKFKPALTWTLGLRYENFGQPANVFRFPAFAGFDPSQFLVPNEVNRDDNNFGPAIGFAWSPSFQSRVLRRLLGEGKTVWRGGYQISYDAFFTQLLNAISGDSPNVMRGQVIAPNSGRGAPNWFAQLPTVPRAPSPLDAQTGVFDKNIRSPYTERWSFGLQRELPNKILLDLSYVGSESHKLFTRADVNPRQLNSQRLYPNLGIRQILTTQGNSAYHALQLRVDRRFANGFQITGSYTWSRNLDSTSEAVAANLSSTPGNVTSVPVSQGGLKLDRGLSDYHRSHRLSIAYLWDMPGPTRGLWKQAFGGWSIAGIATFQSGTPFTVLNGSDRNNDGLQNDRPDISNANAPINTRAFVAPTSGPRACPTGYRNPDTGTCVTPADVHFIEGRGLPDGSTVGRNTLFAGGINNWDVNLSKAFAIAEAKRLEFRWEASNVFNHPQFVNVPERDVVSSPPGRFLNRDFTDSGIRTIRVQLKLIF